MQQITDLLSQINPDFIDLKDEINRNIDSLNKCIENEREQRFSQEDTFIITYADQFIGKDHPTLFYLNEFIEKDLKGIISHVHILPFYPWTSDDGFSPTSYLEVDSRYGSWADIKKIKAAKMFDCVFNHLSSKSEFFVKALEGDKKYQDMFHFFSEEEYQDETFQENLKKIVRPRVHPVMTKFDVKGESKYVWTTFSDDQIDVNLNNKNAFKYILESFFLYVENGARYFRIDAVPFLWKELGTNCSHLEKTHLIVKLFRAICEQLNFKTTIVTESNVPHEENITYWGNGTDEAHLIYNFSLSPLILHALTFKDSSIIEKWGKEVFKFSNDTSFFNFTSTHDGIGMRGLEGIVPEIDIEELCAITIKQKGQIGRKMSRDGTIRPYELNITWASFLKDNDLNEEMNIKKVVNSQGIIMFFPGVSAHYIHNFFGSYNWQEGFEESGIARRLNRKKLDYPIKYTVREKSILDRMLKLIEFKKSHDAFSPTAKIEFVHLDKRLISFKRSNSETFQIIFNLTKDEVVLSDNSLLIGPYELQIISKDSVFKF